jgi:molecular chaperone DnaK
MSKIVGIDLGTTNSLVAIVDSGIPLVLADADGQRLTPSVVNLPKNSAKPVVGRLANRLRTLRPRETIYSIKRLMGRRAAEILKAELDTPYPITTTGNGPATIDLHGRSWTPEEISAEILKKLREDAELALSETVNRAVITVPAYFNDAQRNATKRAGELAGFTVERIINEPTAAALAYGLDKLKEKSKIAVYDLGGGTFDLSILELNEGVFQVIATHGNTRLGGDDIDRAVTEFLAKQVEAQSSVRLAHPDSATENPEMLVVWSKLREVAEQAKIKLSSETEAEITLPFLLPNFSFHHRLTRADLERIARPILLRTREHCLRSLSDARLEATQLHQVILVGGQTRMPLVRQLVAEWFGCADFEETRGGIRLGTEYHEAKGPLLNTGVNPDEAVALGAAIQAGILSGDLRNVLLLDVTPLSLGLETFGGLMNVIIPRNTTIPAKAGEMFTTAVDNQREMLIHVLQGERERAKDNWSLGKFTVVFERAPRGVPRVGVQFEIDANGILNVLARDTHSGRETIVPMKSAVDVDDEAVTKMVEESVEHAFTDLATRRWVEAKLKANEITSAARKCLNEVGEDLEPDYVAQVEAALQAVANALATEQPDTGGGDTNQLQSACKALDEATQPLAELLMERVTEELLKQRGLT